MASAFWRSRNLFLRKMGSIEGSPGGGASPPPTRWTAPHFGHWTSLPARSSFSAYEAPHAHDTWIAMYLPPSLARLDVPRRDLLFLCPHEHPAAGGAGGVALRQGLPARGTGVLVGLRLRMRARGEERAGAIELVRGHLHADEAYRVADLEGIDGVHVLVEEYGRDPLGEEKTACCLRVGDAPAAREGDEHGGHGGIVLRGTRAVKAPTVKREDGRGSGDSRPS